MPNVTTTVDPMTSDMVSTACEDTFFPEQDTDAGQGIPQPAAVNSLEMCREVCLGVGFPHFVFIQVIQSKFQKGISLLQIQ